GDRKDGKKGDGDGDKGRVEKTAALNVGDGSQVCRAEGASRPLPDDVHEASGAAPSRAHQGIFWTHNDSGDPVVYAIDADGGLAGRVTVAGARVADWEDVAVAPCVGGDCLYIADIGDNQAARPSVTVYRVREPAPGDAATQPAEAIELRYPGGAQDAEAMFVLNGAIHIVSKGETGPIALYRAPAGAGPGQPAQLERVRELATDEQKRSQRITGASASPDGRWIAIRTLKSASFYPAAEFVGASGGTAREMDLSGLGEAQGEGIGFASSSAVILTSEGGKKKDPATFARLQCTLQ
ncbi:MAG TPA: hypothetical protein VFR81_02885, partial [Longimicrobium sp.]|nr:hypothetical protein [Longimicrobium sp.]